MTTIFYFCIVVLIVVFFAAFKIIRRKRLEEEFEQRAESFHQSINDFNEEYSAIRAHYISKSEETALISKWNSLYSEISRYRLSSKHKLFNEIERFKAEYVSIGDSCRRANENFIRSESIKHNLFFSNIDGKSLDEQQRAAVITDDDRILVLAGAGSGKTLTIAAKVKYLCEIKNVSPQQEREPPAYLWLRQ